MFRRPFPPALADNKSRPPTTRPYFARRNEPVGVRPPQHRTDTLPGAAASTLLRPEHIPIRRIGMRSTFLRWRISSSENRCPLFLGYAPVGNQTRGGDVSSSSETMSRASSTDGHAGPQCQDRLCPTADTRSMSTLEGNADIAIPHAGGGCTRADHYSAGCITGCLSCSPRCASPWMFQTTPAMMIAAPANTNASTCSP